MQWGTATANYRGWCRHLSGVGGKVSDQSAAVRDYPQARLQVKNAFTCGSNRAGSRLSLPHDSIFVAPYGWRAFVVQSLDQITSNGYRTNSSKNKGIVIMNLVYWSILHNPPLHIGDGRWLSSRCGLTVRDMTSDEIEAQHSPEGLQR